MTYRSWDLFCEFEEKLEGANVLSEGGVSLSVCEVILTSSEKFLTNDGGRN
jgi:hypothetical protein